MIDNDDNDNDNDDNDNDDKKITQPFFSYRRFPITRMWSNVKQGLYTIMFLIY